MRSKQPIELRHITRVDYKRSRGWWVRFYKNATLIASKLFSDAKYVEGKEEALFWAKQWRDEYLEEFRSSLRESKWTYFPPPFMTEPRRNNKSGTVGVYRCSYLCKKPTCRYRYVEWRATWMETGKPKLKGFSVKMYGERGAKEQAIAHRRLMEDLIRSQNKELLLAA